MGLPGARSRALCPGSRVEQCDYESQEPRGQDTTRAGRGLTGEGRDRCQSMAWAGLMEQCGVKSPSPNVRLSGGDTERERCFVPTTVLCLLTSSSQPPSAVS